MADEINGLIISPEGHTGHIQLNGDYVYIDGSMSEFITLDGKTVESRHLERMKWFLLAEESLVKWSKE